MNREPPAQSLSSSPLLLPPQLPSLLGARAAGVLLAAALSAPTVAASLGSERALIWQTPQPVPHHLQRPACGQPGAAGASLPLPFDDGEGLLAAYRRAGFTRLWGVAENISVQSQGRERVLRLRFPAGSYRPGAEGAPRGGAGFLAPLLRAPHNTASGTAAKPVEAACLSYRLRFPENFDFVKGGKLPGLYGGDAPSGGEAADGSGGFSMRLMWRRGGALEAYAYVANSPTGEAASIGRGSAFAMPGRWASISIELRMNQPEKDDGVLRLWVDGVQRIERRDLAYRRNADLGIDGLMFSSFFGGNDRSWATPREQYIDFADFRLHAE